MRVLIVGLLIAGLIAGGAFYYRSQAASGQTSRFRTARVERGDMVSTITATGTIEPEEVIDVGAQVMGRIRDLGIDFDAEKKIANLRPSDDQKQDSPASDSAAAADKRPRIDYGSIVHVGTELAYIDDIKYKAQVQQAQAALDRSLADLGQLEAKAAQTAAELRRAERLRELQQKRASPNQVPLVAISESEYDMAVANDKVAKANLKVGKAVIEQNRASLMQAQTDLDYTIIRSPVEGVIVDRRMNIGQTVVAALNAPSMFLIAKDLSCLQVWASVNEADIGRIRQGIGVRFTVDAFPGETFEGRVKQIRLNAQMTQNVVTYTVVVETENPNGRLLPYLAASLQFEIDRHDDQLLVPNAALRWIPQNRQIAPDARLASGGRGPGGVATADRGPGERPNGKPSGTGSRREGVDAAAGKPNGRLWVKEGEFVRPVPVQTGSSDGAMTVVSGEGVKEGMEVVVGEEVAEPASAEETKNPFGPPRFRGKSPPPPPS